MVCILALSSVASAYDIVARPPVVSVGEGGVITVSGGEPGTAVVIYSEDARKVRCGPSQGVFGPLGKFRARFKGLAPTSGTTIRANISDPSNSTVALRVTVLR